MSHVVEPLGVPGNQDESQAAVLPAGRVVRRQHGGLLAFHRAAGDEHQVGRGQAEKMAQLTCLCVVPIAFEPVILYRASDADSMTRNTQVDEAPGVSPHSARPRRRCCQALAEAGVASFGSRDNSSCSSGH